MEWCFVSMKFLFTKTLLWSYKLEIYQIREWSKFWVYLMNSTQHMRYWFWYGSSISCASTLLEVLLLYLQSIKQKRDLKRLKSWEKTKISWLTWPMLFWKCLKERKWTCLKIFKKRSLKHWRKILQRKLKQKWKKL